MLKRIVLFLFLCCSLTEAKAQMKDWAAGFRVGEPGGFMIKRYLPPGKNAVEFNFGTYGGLWGTNRSYQDGSFQNIGFSLNALYLWHRPTLVNSDLHYYYGAGPQFVSRNLFSNNSVYPETKRGLGAASIAGLEYFPIDAPNLSFFAELGLYTELLPNPIFKEV
ncbi:MAG: hypothetical protein RLZZ197_6 [Bacteroidota bacterium]